MNNNTPDFDAGQAATLAGFLDGPQRSPDAMTYSEAAGFLFMVACAPELVQPAQWVPLVIDPDNAPDTSFQDKQAVLSSLFSLYNEINRQVQEEDVRLPPGCEFVDETLTNLEPTTVMSQWARGFRRGYLMCEKMWSEYIAADIKEEFAHHVTVLCFFHNRAMAEEMLEKLGGEGLSLAEMASDMRRIFPDAMSGFALLGNSIQKAVAKRQQTTSQPVQRAKKIGRNDPCSCGSGKKYKKCCGVQ
jgi:uncharacterized protein